MKINIFLTLVDGMPVVRARLPEKALREAEKRSLGRINTCTAALRVGDAESLMWFRNGVEVDGP